jgi:hypothetical protein
MSAPAMKMGGSRSWIPSLLCAAAMSALQCRSLSVGGVCIGRHVKVFLPVLFLYVQL